MTLGVMGVALVMKYFVSYCQGNAVFAFHYTVKAFNQLYITNKMEHFNFKSGRAMQVVRLIKEVYSDNYSKNFGSK